MDELRAACLTNKQENSDDQDLSHEKEETCHFLSEYVGDRSMIASSQLGLIRTVMERYCSPQLLANKLQTLQVLVAIEEGCTSRELFSLLTNIREHERKEEDIRKEELEIQREQELQKWISKKEIDQVVLEHFGRVSFFSSCDACDCRVSIMYFYLARIRDPSNILLLCLSCLRADQDKGAMRKMHKETLKMQVWMYRHGDNSIAVCPLCDDEMQLHFDHDSTQVCHDVAVKLGGSKSLENLFIAHTLCNRDQETLSLHAHRSRAGLGKIAPPSMTSDQAKTYCLQLKL
jgi:5-methylcytosine-specific restriction endonuclease McrA